MLPLRLAVLVNFWLAVPWPTFAQPSAALLERAQLQPLLSFETGVQDGRPAGWRGGPTGTVFAETEAALRGHGAGRLVRDERSDADFSSITTALPLLVSGRELELRGFLRTENASGPSGLWLRIDGDEGVLEFSNMQSQRLTGTTPWTSYAVRVPLNAKGRQLVFGALLSGTGTLWVDELELLVDGKPIWDAPRVEPTLTVLDHDREFVAGSRITQRAFSALQVENLALLGETWGFLKYHHPRVIGGAYHWDFELFRIMPAVLAAPDASTAQDLLAAWIGQLGPVAAPAKPLEEPTELHLPPESTWLHDVAWLGSRLSERLRAVHVARPKQIDQFYLARKPVVQNPEFTHELVYGDITFPDAGYQLLGLFRFWNIIRYWSPYRNLLEDDWRHVLREFIPRLGAAATRAEYERELIALTARVHDTHTNIWGPGHERPPRGPAHLPAVFRFIEDELIVVDTLEDSAVAAAPALQRGDAIRAIDGRLVAGLVREFAPFYPASNEPTRRRDLAWWIGRGPAGAATLRVQRDSGPEREMTIERIPAERYRAHRQSRRTHDRPGPAFQRLGPDVAYLKLSAATAADAFSYVEQATGTRGWILDLRGYPGDFLVFKLGGHFVRADTPFVRFTTPIPSHPGAFQLGAPLVLAPRDPHYPGRVVILVDEVTQSSSEYHAMAFRAAPRSLVVGSTTAGADGNVSRFSFPGGFTTMISGIGVFYPDKRPTQRVGIVPDVVVTPTRAGIIAGRDEILEEGLRQILGREAEMDGIFRGQATDAVKPAHD